MKNSDVMWGALRIAHFEVKEDSGSLTLRILHLRMSGVM